MLSDELRNLNPKVGENTIALSPEDQQGVDLALRTLRVFDRSLISTIELANDKYLGEESVVEHLSFDGKDVFFNR